MQHLNQICQTLAVLMGPGVGYTGTLPVRLSCALSINHIRVQVAARRGPGRGGGERLPQHSCLYIGPLCSRVDKIGWQENAERTETVASHIINHSTSP